MKCLKVFALAAVAAMAIMVFLGVSSASATVLCKTTPNANSCPSEWDYPAATVVDISLEGTMHFTAPGTDNTCTTATLKGATATTGSATTTVSGNFNTVRVENCTCTTHVTSNGSFEIHWTPSTHNGSFTGKGTAITFVCFEKVGCVYGTAASGTVLGKVTASATSTSAATLDVEATLPKLEGGFLCAATAEMTGTFAITEPKPLYVAETP